MCSSFPPPPPLLFPLLLFLSLDVREGASIMTSATLYQEKVGPKRRIHVCLSSSSEKKVIIASIHLLPVFVISSHQHQRHARLKIFIGRPILAPPLPSRRVVNKEGQDALYVNASSPSSLVHFSSDYASESISGDASGGWGWWRKKICLLLPLFPSFRPSVRPIPLLFINGPKVFPDLAGSLPPPLPFLLPSPLLDKDLPFLLSSSFLLRRPLQGRQSCIPAERESGVRIRWQLSPPFPLSSNKKTQVRSCEKSIFWCINPISPSTSLLGKKRPSSVW